MLMQVLQKACRNSLQQRVSKMLNKGEKNQQLSNQLKNRMSVNLGLLFCPVVVVQSCVPGWACHSRRHWAHHSTVLEGAIKVQADNELMKMGITKFRWLRRAGVSLNLNLQTSDESRNGIDLGQRLELRQVYCFTITFLSLYSWALNLPFFSYYSCPQPSPTPQKTAKLSKTENRNCLLKQLVCFNSRHWQSEAEREKRL